MNKGFIFVFVLILVISGCQKKQEEEGIMTFQKELQFLEKHIDVIVLSDSADKSKLIVVPAWQGRVMTSTADGDDGLSFGWINHELIASGELQEHINVFGGEDRFWLGPEGGQFAIFFKKGDPFDLDHWYVPPVIDTEAYDVMERQQDRVTFGKSFNLVNYSDVELKGDIRREVKLLGVSEISAHLGLEIPESVNQVGYVSVNTIQNTGENPWAKESGMLSIWILGMFTPSPETTVVIPFIEGEEAELGPIVNDTYFGKVPDSRLKIKEGFVFFKGDGLYRSKIGLSPSRSKPFLGSYDAGNRVLTLVTYTKPEDAVDYVNSMWELQEVPFAGDVVNSYNDGPPEPGAKPLGPFYELETSSPAAALEPGQSLTHENRTFHFQGEEEDLNKIALSCLGLSLDKIKSGLESGETASESAEPGWLSVEGADLRGHDIIDSETSEKIGKISSLAGSLTLMPGEYRVTFGSLEWPVFIEEGQTTTLNPGVVTVDGASFRGHTIRTKDGQEVGSVSNTASSFTLPPGEYTIEVGGQTVAFTLGEGKQKTFEEKESS
jgi:hypothetical protein